METNTCIIKTQDDWKIFSEFVEENDSIKQDYYRIRNAPDHHKYVGFSWVTNGQKMYFVFTFIPFDLTSAPFISTKSMRARVKHWREQAIKIACFVDDGSGTKHTYESTWKTSNLVLNSLKNLGL